MQYRLYDIITQLIPGTFFIGFSLFIMDYAAVLTRMELGSFALIGILSFIVGFVLNGISHFIESLFLNNFNDKAKKAFFTAKPSSIFRLLKRFTRLKDGEIEGVNDTSQDFKFFYHQLNSDDKKQLEWKNEDIKFSRVMIMTTFFLIPVLLFTSIHYRVEASILGYLLFLLIILLVSIYRYLHYRIDYVHQVIRIVLKKNQIPEAKP